jgi:hypothetical protein
MKWSERWFWFWVDLLQILVEEYWICPYCGSTRVAEIWEILEGRFRDGSTFGPYGGHQEHSSWACDDCQANWTSWDSPLEYSWREWKYKGKIIK